MSAISMGAGRQTIKPPQRGIFPLDHDRTCKEPMEAYLNCLKEQSEIHHKCRDYSRDYLQCRMDNELMARENLDDLGYSEQHTVEGAKAYDKRKEKQGFVA